MKLLAFLITCIAFVNTPIQNEFSTLNPEMEEASKGNNSFAIFLSHFEKTDALIEIDHSKIQAFKSTFLREQNLRTNAGKNRNAELRNFIPEFINGHFSRIGLPLVQPLNRFYPDENTIAVTYLTRNSFNDSGFDVRLALFDLKGNHITHVSDENDELKYSIGIAGLYMQETKLCAFSKPNVFKITTFKNVWEKEVKEFGIQNNTISCYEKINSEMSVIKSKGEIVSLGGQIELRA